MTINRTLLLLLLIAGACAFFVNGLSIEDPLVDNPASSAQPLPNTTIYLNNLLPILSVTVVIVSVGAISWKLIWKVPPYRQNRRQNPRPDQNRHMAAAAQSSGSQNHCDRIGELQTGSEKQPEEGSSSMKDKVYVIANYGNSVYQRGSGERQSFESHFATYQDFLSAQNELRFGHGYPEDKFPEALEFSLENYFGDHAEEGLNYAADAELDHICSAEVPYVSPELKAVLEQFDLGATTFPPVQVTVLRSNGTRTPYERYFLNLRSVKKDCVLLDQSFLNPPMKPILPPPPDAPPKPFKIKRRRYTLEPKGLTLSRDCLEGPDLWTDPMVEETVFAKGALIEALTAAGLVDNMELQEVTLV